MTAFALRPNPSSNETPHLSISGPRKHRDLENRRSTSSTQSSESNRRLISIIAGDAIQNLRHALDYLVYELSPPRFRNRGKTQFPVFADECEFKVLARPYIKGIEGDERTLIERLQPYHAQHPSRDPLAVLSRLANKDKHRLLLATAAATAETDTWISSTNADIAIHYFAGGPVEHDAKILAFTATPEDPTEDMYVQPKSALEIQLKEAEIQPNGPYIEICGFVEYLITYVEHTVIDRWFKWGSMRPANKPQA